MAVTQAARVPRRRRLPAVLMTGLLASTLGAAALGPTAPAAASPALSTWHIDYDPAVPTAARPAVQRAVDAWAAAFTSDQQVVLAVTWATVAGAAFPASGAPADQVVHRPDNGVLYPVALEEAAEHTDLNSGGPDLRLALDPAAPWSYDPSGASPATYDLTTLAMRALGTGLGLGSTLTATAAGSGWTGSYGADSNADGVGDGSYPAVYDAFLSASSPYAATLLDYPNASPALGAALTGGRLVWTGPQALAAGGGSAPRLYAPPAWSPGRSAGYLDEATYPAGSRDALMTPDIARGEVITGPGVLAPAMLADLLSSPGAAGAPVRHYVNGLYNSFLFRDADPVGLPYWTQQLVSASLSRAQLAGSLSRSPEYLETVVRRLYVEVLGRPADPAGLSGWVQRLQTGTQISTVGAGFYASDENFALTGGTTSDPGPWVESLYRALLGRASDSGGRAYWVSQARAKGRLFVTTSFYGSTETLVRRVNNLYLTLLDRDADPTGLAFWPAVVGSQGDLALAATLATSDEYYLRSQLFPLPAG